MLDGMTQEKWNSIPKYEREKIRDLSDLSPQLLGLEGWRVEVETHYGEIRRFIVSRSTGWKPIHIEVHNRSSSGGVGAEKDYRSVQKLYKAR